jgi:uncharacterized membrane protein
MNPSDLELIGITAGIVAVLRKHVPKNVKLDGPIVLLCTLAVAILVCAASDTSPTWSGASLKASVLRGLRVAIGASGGVSLLGYAAGKLGASVNGNGSSKDNDVPIAVVVPDSPPSPNGGPPPA